MPENKYNLYKLKHILYLLIIYIFIRKIQHYSTKNAIKISVFLPIYNKENYLAKVIENLQNQTLKDIEIVALNDCSNDSSLEILNNLSKNDQRIKIINNDKNHGLLYSRAMGILNCSGEYLMNLDPDDEIKGEDSLEYLYKQSKYLDLDIISFNALDKKSNSIIKCIGKNIMYKQPDLFYSLFNRNNVIREYAIWNKLIKKEIYLSAYEDFKDEIYNGKWNYFEDDIWNILVNRHAKSRLCINKVIYIYNYNKDSLMNQKSRTIEFKNLIYRHEMYEKLFSLKKDEKYLLAEYYFLIKRFISLQRYLLLLNNKDINNQIINIIQFFLKKYECSDDEKNNLNDFLNLIK
jgi:glycosyltransferase involved in cell wall biosynthesis